MHKALINEIFKKRIEDKIAELEKQSSLEFVPVIVSRSASYFSTRQLLCWMSVATFLLATKIVSVKFPNQSDIGFAFLTGLLVLFGSAWPPLLQTLVPRSKKQQAVSNAAHLQFLKQEVFATHARSGILIFISIFEEAVYILADRGVSSHIKDSEWSELGQKLARDFDSKNPGESFIEALEEMSQRLLPHFPLTTPHQPELSNKVRSPDSD